MRLNISSFLNYCLFHSNFLNTHELDGVPPRSDPGLKYTISFLVNILGDGNKADRLLVQISSNFKLNTVGIDVKWKWESLRCFAKYTNTLKDNSRWRCRFRLVVKNSDFSSQTGNPDITSAMALCLLYFSTFKSLDRLSLDSPWEMRALIIHYCLDYQSDSIVVYETTCSLKLKKIKWNMRIVKLLVSLNWIAWSDFHFIEK